MHIFYIQAFEDIRACEDTRVFENIRACEDKGD